MTTTTPPLPDEPPGNDPRPNTAEGVGIDPATRTQARVTNRGWYALLLIPFVALLWLPFYARRTPELFGFPFFYWYQFLWVFIGAGITGLVYVLTTTSDAPPAEATSDRARGGSHRRGGRP